MVICISILVSCSGNDDDSSVQNSVSGVIGSWELYKEVDGETVYNYDGCERDILTFYNDGNALTEYFSQFNLDGTYVESGNCRKIGELDLRWSSIGNNQYRLSMTGLSEIDGDGFSIQNNEFQIIYSDGFTEYWKKKQ